MIKIFDTTLRDGEQSPGCSMNLSEKLEVARALDRMRVDVIEAGFAVISKGDFESVRSIAENVKHAAVASLARAVKKDIDAAAEALKPAQSPCIHVFLATSPLHMTYKLKMTEEKVLKTITEAVGYAKALCPNVEFSAEDAMRSEPAFLAKAVSAAIKAGAKVVNIPDTVGYVTPPEITQMLAYLRENVEGINDVTLSVHCHNDLGLAVANSLAAVTAGATQIECTINGLGERAGNAALEEIVMGLTTRKDLYPYSCGVDTTQIYRASRLVYNIIGMTAPINKPIVGANAFAHESGIHQHGVLANRETYEIMTPQSIGLVSNKMVLGKHSGRHAIESRLSELGFSLGQEELDTFFEAFKALSDKKKEITDYDLEALASSQLADNQDGYKLDRFTINSGNYTSSNAVVRLIHGDELIEEVALGDGPVDAAFNAIDKIIRAPEHALDDYAIHSISEGNDALGEVMVKIKCGNNVYSGRGLSTDILEASILAYVNGLNKIIYGGHGHA